MGLYNPFLVYCRELAPGTVRATTVNMIRTLASDGIKLNMMWMERVKICKIKL